MANKVSATMSTLVDLDTMQAAQQLRTIKNEVAAIRRESENASEALRQSGDEVGAAQKKYEGYNDQLKAQTEYLQRLQKEHDQLGDLLSDRESNINSLSEKLKGMRQQVNEAKKSYDELRKSEDASDESILKAKQTLKDYRQELHDTTKQYNDLSNGKADEKFARQAKQIENARAQQLKLRAEVSKSQDAYNHQLSGLDNLQAAYKQAQSASRAYADRLQAEHREASASVARYNEARDALKSLREQYSAQNNVLESTTKKYGENSEQAIKEKERLDQVGTSMARARDKALELNRTTIKFRPTGSVRVNNAITRISDNSLRMRDHMSHAFDTIRSHAMSLSIAIGGIGAAMIKGANEASSLQNTYLQTKNLLTTGGENPTEAAVNVRKMQSGGRDLSIDYGVDQRSIAAGYKELTKRGYSSGQSLAAMKTMLQASVASGDDLQDVITSSTNAIESFGLRVDNSRKMLQNTKRTVNQLAYAADMTATDYSGISEAMKFAGPQAKTLGYGVGQTAAAIGVLSNNGLESDKAGTGMRQVLNSLLNPSAKAKKRLKDMGLSASSFRKSNGDMKSISQIFKLLNEHTQGKGNAEKGAIFKDLFGATGESAGIILANNTDQLNKVEKGVNNSYKGQGYVQKLAKKNMGSSKMATRQFKQATNAVTTTLGSALMPALRDASVQMAKFLNSSAGKRDLNSLARTIKTISTAVVKFGTTLAKHKTAVKSFAAAFGLLLGVGKIVSWVVKMREAITIIGGVSKALKLLRLAFIGTGIGALVVAVAALTAGFIHLYSTNAKFRNFIKGLGVIVKNVAKTLLKFSPAGILISGFVKLYKHNKKFRHFVNDIVSAVKKAFGGMFNWIKDKINALKNGAKKLYNHIANIGKSGSEKHPAHSYASGTSGTVEDQVAMVNDATGQNWREMLLRDNQLYAFPKKRNIMTYLKSGDQVITGDAAEKLARQRGYRHYADGQGDKWSPININDRGATDGLQNDFKGRLQSQYDAQIAHLKNLLAQAKATQQRTIQVAQTKAKQIIATAQRLLNLAITKANQIKANAIAKAQNVYKTAEANAEMSFKKSRTDATNRRSQTDQNARNSYQESTKKAQDAKQKSDDSARNAYNKAVARINKMKISQKKKNKKIYDADGRMSNKFSRNQQTFDRKTARQNQTLRNRISKAEDTYNKAVSAANVALRNAKINAETTLRTSTNSANKAQYDSQFEANKSFNSSRQSANQQLAKSTQSANDVYNKSVEQINKQIQAVQNWHKRVGDTNRYASGSDGVNEDQVAMVNDGNGSNWREMMFYHGVFMPFPAVRNLMSFIPKGAQILNGDNAAKLMSKGANRFYDGIGAINSYISDVNTAGDVSHNESRKTFMKQLQNQFNNYLKQINDNLKQLAQTLQQAKDALRQAISDAHDQFSKSQYDAQSDYQNAMTKARGEMQTAQSQEDYNNAFNDQRQARQAFNQAIQQARQAQTQAVNQANEQFSKTSQTVSRQRKLADTNKARLNSWYSDNVSQFDHAAAAFADGGIATMPSIFGEAGPEAAIPLDSLKSGRAWTTLQKVVDYYAGNSGSSPATEMSASSNTSSRTNELLTDLIGLASQLLQGQRNEGVATRQSISGIKGYDRNEAFRDTSQLLRQAQMSNLTY